MKKITFKFFAILTLLVATITNAQTVSITSINSEAPATYLTNNAPLSDGTVLSIELTYTDAADMGAGENNLLVRILDNWAFIAGTLVETSVTPGTSGTVTLDVTVPAINPGTTLGRIQARAYKVGGGFANNTAPTFEITAAAVEVTATVAITTINGSTVADYHTANSGILTEGDVLTIGVDYTAIKPNPGEADAVHVKVRFLTDAYGTIPEATTVTMPVTESNSSQSTTLSLTVPNLGASLAGVRIQAIGYGWNGAADGARYGYASNTFDIDHTTLSLSKTVLEGVTVDGATISFGSQHLNDTYTIFNITGQAVKSGSVASTISITSLSSGVYFLSTEKGSLKFAK